MDKEEAVLAYFACSFRAQDRRLIKWFRNVCEGVGMQLINVNKFDQLVPAPRARELMQQADCCVALGTKRDQLTDDTGLMPRAVEHELSFAFALRKPVLVFVEEGVEMGGLFPTMLTWGQPFNRKRFTDEFTSNAIEAIRKLRIQALEERSIGHHVFSSDYVATEINSSLRLELTNGHATWKNELTKQLKFDRPFDGYLTSSFWPVPGWTSPSGSNASDYRFTVDAATSDIEAEEAVKRRTDHSLDLHIHLSPKPRLNNVIKYNRYFASPYLHPLFKDEKTEMLSGVTIDDVHFDVYDGVLISERTDLLHFHCTFPQGYGLRKNSVHPFCAERLNRSNCRNGDNATEYKDRNCRRRTPCRHECEISKGSPFLRFCLELANEK
jgi:hypothetical protein